MQYHIQTTPIWDAFRSGCECPLCALYDTVEGRLIGQYLNEAVMEPDYRVKVNKRGFCPGHLTKLYAGKNKLGLALQLHTRSLKLLENMRAPANPKAAKKESERLREDLGGCVICDEADETLARYAYTIVEMFAREREFPSLFCSSKGFCLPHYALLLRYASHAGGKAGVFLTELCSLERKRFSELAGELESFTNQYDYRNARASGGARDALPRMIAKIKGISEPPA